MSASVAAAVWRVGSMRPDVDGLDHRGVEPTGSRGERLRALDERPVGRAQVREQRVARLLPGREVRGHVAVSPAACARREAEQRPLAAVIVVYAKCFC
jgi:hypothetical protein